MKNIDTNTIILLIVLGFLIFSKGCDSSQEELKEYLEQQNTITLVKFDSLQNTIDNLELEVVQRDTTINIYRNNYYEISKDIDSITSSDALRDSIRSKLKQLGSARFD